MQTTFLNPAGAVLFVRDDMEQGNWTQEEYTVNATFPYNPGKLIERGQRISFRDPATNSIEVFEIRNVSNIEPDHYQQIIAEHISVSELSDEHINTQEITNKTPAQALTTALTGTLWAVGNVSVTRTSSADIARGSVWQAVGVIAQNWNVYIVPRVTVNAAGAITGRFLDVIESNGTWRGLRLSIDKNMSDSSVVYDDSETLTALYGYGGTVEQTQSGADDQRVEVTFASVVWSATSSHPAKPAGQTYLEDPAKTALYGRNGRPRFGFYQNGDITDPAVLLEKTWEALKLTSSPKISISGTVSDLYRLGYKDQPIRLHDMAIVEISETGEKFYLQIIKNDVDLIDPTATRPEIGAYIPNIIYINRESMEKATGGGGGGGGRGQDNKEFKEVETYSSIEKTDNMIALVVGTRNGNNYIKAGEIGLAINKSGESGSYESTAYINANHINISATDTAYTLAGDLEHDANGRLVIKNAGGLYVTRNSAVVGVWDKGNLTGGVMVSTINGQTSLKLKADVIDVAGIVNDLAAYAVTVGSLQVEGQTDADTIYCTFVDAETLYAEAVVVDGNDISNPIVSASVSENTLTLTHANGDSVNFSKAATLQTEYGGSNSGTVATYTVTGNPADNFPSGNVATGSFTLHIISSAAYVTDPSGTIRAWIANSYTDTAYKNGWNDCIDAATQVSVYTRTAGTYGGSNYQHYVFVSGRFENIGDGWYKTQSATAYSLPAKK